MAQCIRCGRDLPVSEFATDASKASGRKSLCRACDREKARRYYERNRERKLAKHHEHKVLKPPRMCIAGCGRTATSSRHRYCDVCRHTVALDRKRARERKRERRRNRLPATQRGYGTKHKQLRVRWAQAVATGGVLCARCGEPIEPGEPWDLGHDDEDRTKYAGAEHRRCNRATASRQPQGQRSQRKSRDW